MSAPSRLSARPVSMVFQENNLFAHLCVEQNVGLGRSPSLRLTEADRAAIAEALERTGLAGKEKRCRANSRAANASASRWPAFWCATGRCFLLDEPFASLGPGLA